MLKCVSFASSNRIALDVHAINELQQKGFPPTDDAPKYSYTTDKEREIRQSVTN